MKDTKIKQARKFRHGIETMITADGAWVVLHGRQIKFFHGSVGINNANHFCARYELEEDIEELELFVR